MNTGQNELKQAKTMGAKSGQMGQNNTKWAKASQNSQKWAKTGQSGPKYVKQADISLNGKNQTKTGQI